MLPLCRRTGRDNSKKGVCTFIARGGGIGSPTRRTIPWNCCEGLGKTWMAGQGCTSPAMTMRRANVLPAPCPRSHTARGHGRASRDNRVPACGRKFMDLRGAVALVTGGNGGLGQRICHALAKEGAHIAVMYAQSRDQAEGVARELTLELSDQRCGVRLRHHRWRGRGAADRRRDQAPRPHRHPGQRRRLQQGDPVHRSRQPYARGVGQDHGRQPDGADAADQGGGARS